MTSSSSSPSPATNDWISEAEFALGYALAFALLFVPIVLVVLLMRTRHFRRRKRVRTAGDLPPYGGRPYMDSLPPPLGDRPPDRNG